MKQAIPISQRFYLRKLHSKLNIKYLIVKTNALDFSK